MIWLIVILVVVALLVLALIVLYNRFVQLRNRVDNAWAQIEVQLKRRWDLIPNLVETVKGYAEHERGTFEAVTQARANAQRASGPAETAAAEGILGQALGRLFAVAEAYPELQADENFRQLQDELGETENRIAVSRQVYNDTVLTYNNAIQTFPGVARRRALQLLKREFFETDETQREVPQVDFSPDAAPAAARRRRAGRPARRARRGWRTRWHDLEARRSRRRSSPRSASQVSPRPRPTRSSRATSRSTSGRTARSRSTRTSRSRSPARSRTASGRSRSAPASASTRSASRRRAGPTSRAPRPSSSPAARRARSASRISAAATRVVWRFESDGFQERTFVVHYRLSGLAVGYDDVVDVNLKVWGDEWEQRLGRLTATMRGPGNVVRAWGHPVWVRGDVTLEGRTRCCGRSTSTPASSSSCERSTRATRSPRRPACRCGEGDGLKKIIAEETRTRPTTSATRSGSTTRSRARGAGCSCCSARDAAGARDRRLRLLALRPRARDGLRPRVRAGAADRDRAGARPHAAASGRRGRLVRVHRDALRPDPARPLQGGAGRRRSGASGAASAPSGSPISSSRRARRSS